MLFRSINGISLTIAKIFASKFKVVIIPHTLQNTNLLKLKKNNNGYFLSVISDLSFTKKILELLFLVQEFV